MSTENIAVIARLESQRDELAEALRELVEAGEDVWDFNRPCLQEGRNALAKLDSEPAEQPAVPKEIRNLLLAHRWRTVYMGSKKYKLDVVLDPNQYEALQDQINAAPQPPAEQSASSKPPDVTTWRGAADHELICTETATAETYDHDPLQGVRNLIQWHIDTDRYFREQPTEQPAVPERWFVEQIGIMFLVEKHNANGEFVKGEWIEPELHGHVICELLSDMAQQKGRE